MSSGGTKLSGKATSNKKKEAYKKSDSGKFTDKNNFYEKNKALFLFLVIAGVVAVSIFAYTSRHDEFYEQVIKVGEKKVFVEVADTDEEQTRGLSSRKNMSENHGMLFVFQNEAQHAFWMKDTYIPLDIIYFSKEMRVTDIKGGFEPCLQSYCRAFIPKNKALYVLEVNAGFAGKYKITEGTEMKILKILSQKNETQEIAEQEAPETAKTEENKKQEIIISDTLKLN